MLVQLHVPQKKLRARLAWGSSDELNYGEAQGKKDIDKDTPQLYRY